MHTAAVAPAAATPVAAPKGHPKGLYLLFLTEMWERMSYYGMRGLLVLFLTDKVHGWSWSTGDALALYGTYTGLVYLTPIAGGYIADNLIGQRKAVVFGGVLMMIGHLLLALPGQTIFYTGLGFLIAGNGFFKPNISTMVGGLYAPGDGRRDGAFTIFYMGINLGAVLGNFVCGTLGEKVGWHWGFGSAGVGMGLGLLGFLAFSRGLLGKVGLAPEINEKQRREAWQKVGVYAVATAVATGVFYALAQLPALADSTLVRMLIAAVVFAVLARVGGTMLRKSHHETAAEAGALTRQEKDRVIAILIIAVFVVIFWMGFEQAGGLMNLYTDSKVDRGMFGWEVPTTWFQNFNSFFIVTLAPLFAMMWTRLAAKGKDPNVVVKMALGLIFMGLGFLFMVGAARESAVMTKAAAWWVIMAYLFHTVGELCLSPVGLSMVTKVAPPRMVSAMMGVWFLSNALANKLSGVVGGYSEKLGELGVFTMLVAVGVVGGGLLWVLSGKVKALMHGTDENRAIPLPQQPTELDQTRQSTSKTAMS
ncbi:peptide MFS transporter [Aggregicoccus sp. 17bor-14]|uniref:peptide MFS transporter n=1 Tax=Myxococcaceae TaxID=31 RepID=UPI00129C84D9|nr:MULTISPECIES: peptide MFS transporter [Myxococcaceae]MBF5041480.1 peptide MFS transporter [Simulacricoccus sp. 17bor-14]MRI87264.1 peptide MFS transporter [Aggregicoccus sp. 17bor-14]